MNVSIDLFPQSNKEKVRMLPLLALAAIAVGVAAFLLIFSYMNAKNSITVLENQIVQQTKARDTLQAEYAAQTKEITAQNFVEKYKGAYTFLHQTYKNPIALQEHVYQFLPSDAVVADYTYENSGSLAMTIDFSSKSDAAAYLNELLFADFVEQAEVEVISANEENDRFATFIRMTLATVEGDES